MDAAAPVTSGIYAITNVINGKQYIGSAIKISKRWRLHCAQLIAGTHHSRHLQRAWNRYGADAFQWTILEVVHERAHLLVREQHYLDTLRPDYNVSPTAGSSLGVKRSPETRQRLAQANRGKRLSAEVRAAMSASHMGRKAWNKGVPCPIHVREINSRLWKGAKRPAISAALKGHRGWNRGMIVSEETRAKLSAAGKGKPKSEEWRRKIAESNKRTRRLAAETRLHKQGSVTQGKLFED